MKKKNKPSVLLTAKDSLSRDYVFTIGDIVGLEPSDKTYFYIKNVKFRLIVSTITMI